MLCQYKYICVYVFLQNERYSAKGRIALVLFSDLGKDTGNVLLIERAFGDRHGPFAFERGMAEPFAVQPEDRPSDDHKQGEVAEPAHGPVVDGARPPAVGLDEHLVFLELKADFDRVVVPGVRPDGGREGARQLAKVPVDDHLGHLELFEPVGLVHVVVAQLPDGLAAVAVDDVHSAALRRDGVARVDKELKVVHALCDGLGLFDRVAVPVPRRPCAPVGFFMVSFSDWINRLNCIRTLSFEHTIKAYMHFRWRVVFFQKLDQRLAV